MLLTSVLGVALIAAKCFSSTPAPYTPLFDPTSAKDGVAVYDSSPYNYTRLEGNAKDVFGDAFESNDSYKTAFDVTPDQAYLDQSYYVMAPSAHMRSGDTDWFAFEILADSLVTLTVTIHTGYLMNGYEVNVHYSEIYEEHPSSYILFSALADLYEYDNQTTGFSKSFNLRAGYYFVELVGGTSAFSYDFLVRAQYMKRSPLDINYLSSFENIGAAYWESDFFPFHKFDVGNGTIIDHHTTFDRFQPNGILEPMLPRLAEVTGQNTFMSSALIVWDPEYAKVIKDQITEMITIYQTALTDLQQQYAQIQTATTAGGVILKILSGLNPVFSKFFKTADFIVSCAAKMLLSSSEIKQDTLENEIGKLKSIANLFTDMVPDDETRDANQNAGKVQVMVLPLVWTYNDLNRTQWVTNYVPDTGNPSESEKFYRAKSYVIPAKPKNAMGRGNFWVLERNSVNSFEDFADALKWSGNYKYLGYIMENSPSIETEYGKIGLMNAPANEGNYMYSVLVRGGYDHQIVAFRPLTSGTFTANLGIEEGLELDVFTRFPTTPSCSSSISRSYTSPYKFQTYTFSVTANRTYFVRVHNKGWAGSPNSFKGTGITIAPNN